MVKKKSDSREVEQENEAKKKAEKTTPKTDMPSKEYYKELQKLQVELVKLQEWIKSKGLRVVVIFEGRDAAGKG